VRGKEGVNLVAELGSAGGDVSHKGLSLAGRKV
jgi:hypothetical protein